MALQTDFADDADLTLLSEDGVCFRVASTHLARASPRFAALCQLAPTSEDGKRTSKSAPRDTRLAIPLPEPAWILAGLLKLVHGLRAPLESLTIGELDALLRAAQRYQMSGAEQCLIYAVRARLVVPYDAQTRDHLRVFADASHTGQVDIAYDVERHLHGANLAGVTLPAMPFNSHHRLMHSRQSRIENFSRKLLDTTVDGMFAHEYPAICRHCGRTEHAYMEEDWRRFAAEMARQFARFPSVDGAAAHEYVQSDIKCLACDCCLYCRQAMFPWSRIRERLLSLGDETYHGIPEGIAALATSFGQPVDS